MILSPESTSLCSHFQRLFLGITLRIQGHGSDGRPVTCLPAPSLGALLPGPLVLLMAAIQDGRVITLMTLSGGDEANAAVAMLVVVPADEAMHPLTCQDLTDLTHLQWTPQ